MPSLTVAMPAFNEIDSLPTVVHGLIDVLRPSGLSFEILIVDDGSTDGTGAFAERLRSELPEVRVAHHERNRGMGAAWRTCGARSRGEWVLLQPADGQVAATTGLRFYRSRGAADLVIGTRAPWQRPRHRRALTVGYRIAARVLLGVDLAADHGACWLFRGEMLRSFRLLAGDRGIAICAEWLYLARRRGASLALEPAEILPRHSGRSKTGRLDDSIATLVDLARVAIAHRVLGRST
jgi:dolichol-phosphate mannosyltransferase